MKQARPEQQDQGAVCDEAVLGGDDYQWQDTPEDLARFQQLYDPDPVLPEGPVAMLPIAQLYVRDLPGLRPPAGKDLLQVLWCPFEHDDLLLPTTAVVWRSAATVTHILADPPEPAVVQDGGRFVPVPCTISPELVTEYPSPLELDEDVYQQLKPWEAGYLGIDVEDLGVWTESPYQMALSVAPGWKIGGYVAWARSGPWVEPCPACGTPTEPVLTIASAEWEEQSWVPYEDGPADMSRYGSGKPTKIQIHDMWDLVIGTCPASPEHPHVLFPGP